MLDKLVGKVGTAIVVDDGSQPPVKVPESRMTVDLVRLPENRGVGGAILAGYKRAHELGFKVAVVLAGDGQMDPDDLDALVAPVLDGRVEYSKGERFTHPEADNIPAVRKWGNYALTHLTMAISGYEHLLDAQCGYTAIDLDALFDRLPVRWLYPRYGFPNDMLIMASAVGFRLAQVPVRPIYGDQPSGLKPMAAILTYPLILARGFFIKLGMRIFNPLSWRKNADPDGDQFLPYW